MACWLFTKCTFSNENYTVISAIHIHKILLNNRYMAKIQKVCGNLWFKFIDGFHDLTSERKESKIFLTVEDPIRTVS